PGSSIQLIGTNIYSGGIQEVRAMTITTAASGTETATIVLNGVTFSASLTNAGSAKAFTAFQVSQAAYGSAWPYVEAVGSVVYFIGDVSGPRSGTYSFSSSTAHAPPSLILAGVTATQTWPPYYAWTNDPLDGTGPSGMTLIVSTTKIFRIQYQATGAAGQIFFYVWN